MVDQKERPMKKESKAFKVFCAITAPILGIILMRILKAVFRSIFGGV
jgi:hypothetical protein